ncbi:MAG: putative sulfate exporter family transporter [Proteobacteria bacterium]|nr:putative sulfate exporter family transporter [Pseudomonadota bacterium]
MVYTQKTPATLIMGVIFAVYGYAVKAGMLGGMLSYLKVSKHADEMIAISLAAGAVGILIGLWQLLSSPSEGHIDYYLSTVAGALFILMVAATVKWNFAPFVAVVSKAMGSVGGTGKPIHKLLGLNYVVIGILTGIVIVNFFKIPSWAENGVRLSRLGLKTGVILLGSLYSMAELAKLGRLSVVLIGFFVLGSVGMVLWMGSRRKIPNSMGGVLSAGMGVCGVSATVASAPVVQAKSTEIAYTIGTILLWGVLMMFIFPPLGHALGLGPVQFGAWAGTGILNSAQVAGAALAFQPDGIETLKVAEIFNITRVLFLPIIVLWLAVWYVKREEGAQKVNVGQVIVGKFPVFVLGFILIFSLSSTGLFAPANHYKGKYFDNSNVKASKMLDDEKKAVLQAEASSVQREDRKAALDRLIENGKVMSIDDDDALRGLVNAKIMSKDANKILKKAHKAVRHTAKRVKKFRQLIVWFFAFGLVGLGMQITFSSIKQAGGQPLIIGTIVGGTKAVGALFVILMFVRETI